MKPSELQLYRTMPDRLNVFRAHRPGETDWIAYTFNSEKAAMFAVQRNVDHVKQYEVHRSDVLCLFTRRGEFEVLVLDKTKPVFQRDVQIVTAQ